MLKFKKLLTMIQVVKKLWHKMWKNAKKNQANMGNLWYNVCYLPNNHLPHNCDTIIPNKISFLHSINFWNRLPKMFSPKKIHNSVTNKARDLWFVPFWSSWWEEYIGFQKPRKNARVGSFLPRTVGLQETQHFFV